MLKRIYSIYDQKAGLFGPLMAFNRDGEAMRALDSTVNSQKQSQVSTHPEDFKMFFMGTFDEESGEMIPEKPSPKFVCTADGFIKK